ncbi:hypothetical protein KDW_33390 [Dictyobacter vulcani]|uniref:DinB-like domain-containing protein n=2 Tax=Dictyobacter vulcani TaxID=2607529 RepID=A0A5J4KS06_9CHLR|nr:hypothetical protein KDW_33390 [Dictyobacter vulcani]
MNYIQHFTRLLQTSTEDFIWATQQIPAEKLYSVSPRRPDSWSVARNILHLQFQEEQVVLPNMRLWLPERTDYARKDNQLISQYASFEALVQDEEVVWLQHPAVETLLQSFQANRILQITLLSQIPATAWEETRPTVWGTVTLRWTVTKTYQHTAEHINDVLKPALYWTGLSITN